jgi:hypothetical protein
LRAGDVDWFKWYYDQSIDSDECKSFRTSIVPNGAEAELCIFLRPRDLNPAPSVTCPDDMTPSADGGEGFTGCCAINRAAVDYTFPVLGPEGGAADVLLRVAELKADAACVPYEITSEPAGG